MFMFSSNFVNIYIYIDKCIYLNNVHCGYVFG